MELLTATPGFYPLHAFWTPEFFRATEIVSAINAYAMETIGLGKADDRLLKDLSLREMLDAVDTVERWNNQPRQSGVPRSLHMVPDQRLTAAVYTLLHFRLRPLDDDQDVVVRFTEKRLGMEFVNALIVIRKERTELEAEQDEAA